MSTLRLPLSITAALLGSTAIASADVPNVAADIAPVHSLVARVMDAVGTPNLIIPPGASPHEYSLRPSEAAALQDADLVFWLGEGLSPWLESAVETLADDATVTTLLEVDATELLDFREGALFEAHDHDPDEDHDEEHDHEEDHEDDEEHDHDEDEDHDHEENHDEDEDHDHEEDHDEDEEHDHDEDEDHDHDDEHGHSQGDHDPHAWLSPSNAAAWLNVIAAQLSAADPDNAGAYFANAAAGIAELEALNAEINSILDAVRGGSFIVFHDGYQYFEVAYDFPASGAISIGDASDPSPARIAEIQDRIRDENVGCVLSEPQFNPGLVATVLDGTDAATAVVDPLGAALEPGAALYPQVMRAIATTLAECLE